MDFTGHQKPRELTSGKQGATHNPVFNGDGYKVAWAELDEDGYESDRLVVETSSPADSDSSCMHRAKVVIYDLKKDIRYTLTQRWDRSVEELAVRYGILSSPGRSAQCLRSSPRILLFFT